MLRTALVVGTLSGVVWAATNDLLPQIDVEVDRHEERVRSAQKEANERIASSKRAAIGRLADLAKKAVRSGELTAANTAWTEVLKLNSSDKDARAHFSALGKLDETLKQVATQTVDHPVAEESRRRSEFLDGRWQRVAANGKTAFFELKSNGTFSVPDGEAGYAAGQWVVADNHVYFIYENHQAEPYRIEDENTLVYLLRGSTQIRRQQ